MVITSINAKNKPVQKRTEAGLIPEAWDVKKLSEIAQFANGKAHEQFINDQGNYIVVNSKFISTEGKIFKRSKENFCPLFIGDVVMVMSDIPNGKALAKCFFIEENGKYALNQRICSFRTDDSDSLYLFYALNRNQYFLSYDSGVGQTNLRKDEVLDCPIALPPSKTEQTAIATALSDVDALIASLDKLIAKKRAIKQATMQQLLTGKTRLPGFSGELKPIYKKTEVGNIPLEWDVKMLNNLCLSIVDGTHYTPKYTKDGIAFYSVENVTANNFSNTKFISLEDHNKLIRRCKLEKGDILLTRIGSLGHTKFVNWDVNASIYVSLALLRMDTQKILTNYMYEYSKSDQFVKNVEKLSLMNAVPIKINMGQIGKIPIPCPPPLEQEAIATILTDMDVEITALEQRRDKTRALKQGMMQELLTGKTRLI